MPIDEPKNNDPANQSPNTHQLVGPLWQAQCLCCLGRAVLRRSFAGQFLCPNGFVRRNHQELQTLLTNPGEAQK